MHDYENAKVIDHLHNRLAMRIAAYITKELRSSALPESTCNLVFDRLSDSLMEEGNDALLLILDDLLGIKEGIDP